MLSRNVCLCCWQCFCSSLCCNNSASKVCLNRHWSMNRFTILSQKPFVSLAIDGLIGNCALYLLKPFQHPTDMSCCQSPKCMIWSYLDADFGCEPSVKLPASFLTLSTVFPLTEMIDLPILKDSILSYPRLWRALWASTFATQEQEIQKQSQQEQYVG